MQSVALIDYGSGNLRSAEKALRRAAQGLDRQVVVTADPTAIAAADRIVLPGVGAFAACMNALAARDGVVEAMHEAVRRRGSPFLGICVGMQLMATRGLEFGETAGLDWIAGDVTQLEPSDRAAKVPHMGWNTLVGDPSRPVVGEVIGRDVYFTHSFALRAKDPADVAATADHGGRLTAAVMRDNMVGAQFHPEKSQDAGQVLLRAFLEWRP